MKPTDEMIEAFWSKVEVQQTGAIWGLEEGLTAALALLPGEPRPATIGLEEAWELFDSRRFLHGHRETMRDSFDVIFRDLFPTPHLSVDRETLLEEATQALKPFSASGWVDDNGWTELACQNDRIVDWFGPSDFRAVVLILSKLEGSSNAKA